MKLRLAFVFLAAFFFATACRKTTPSPASPARDADADAPAPVVAPQPDASAAIVDSGPPARQRRLTRRGVNLSGAEFGKVPGVHGVDYTWDKTDAAADYFVARGFNHFRIPFRHERLQPKLMGRLDATEHARMIARVTHITKLGATVMLEAHNSYRHGAGCVASEKANPNCKIVSEAEIADFWVRVVAPFKDNPLVQVNVTNEPHDMPTEAVAKNGEAVRAALRASGFPGLVAVPGGGWAGAGHFDEDFNGTTRSSKALLAISADDAAAIDLHLYFDRDANGDEECASTTIGVERLGAPVEWLRKQGRHATIGEIGAINTDKCRAAVTAALTFLESNADVIDSWAWWSSGAWSFATIYPLSLGPVAAGQPEKPQLAWLKPFLDSPARAGDLDGGAAKP